MQLFDKLFLNKSIPPFLEGKGDFVIDDLMGFALLIATVYQKKKTKYLIITSNLYKAQNLYNLLSGMVENDKVSFFPMDELIRAEAIAESKEMTAQRLYTLHSIQNGQSDIVIANVAAANRFLPNPDFFIENTFKFSIGKSYNLSKIRKDLVTSGYTLVNKIDQSLQFAIRGDILDIFSVNLPNPVRLEFFGDELESIRFFDIATQTSTSKINTVKILPAKDVILNDEQIENGIKKIQEKLKKNQAHLGIDSQEKLAQNIGDDITNLLERNFTPKMYKYYSFITGEKYSIFDYAKDFTKIIYDTPQVLSSNRLLLEESWNYFQDLIAENRMIPGLEVNQDISQKINNSRMICTYPLQKSFK
ncbi:MAG: hypothetical protein WCZ24_02885, partial [Bacilli bacterium]